MLKVQIGGTLESVKDNPAGVECHNDTVIQGNNANPYEMLAVAELICAGLRELFPSLIGILGPAGIAEFFKIMNRPFMEWAQSDENQK